MESNQINDLAHEITEIVIDEVTRRRAQRTATYRVQLHHQFTFHDAAAIVPYLHELGVSHVYCSPYLRAKSKSLHGYDICDHNQLNPELGGEEGYQEFTSALQAHGMGHILDIVANHVSASLENPLWFDVLENGPLSPYAHFFDIDWQPIKQELANKVLLPVLGCQYGEALEDGQLQLELRDGAFYVCYYEHKFPISVKSTLPLLKHGIEDLRSTLGEGDAALTELESIITAAEHLPAPVAQDPAAVRELQREKEIIKRRLRDLTTASPPIAEHLAKNLTLYNGDRQRPESFDLLDRLLGTQSYRVCQWRAAADEINYRRFFDVNDLAAICMESPDVFFRTHAFVRAQLADAALDGLRIDHVDGLFDPEQYLYRLQWAHLADLAEKLGRQRFQQWLSTRSPDDDKTGASPADEPTVWRDLACQVIRLASRQYGLRQPGDDDLRAVLFPDAAWMPPQALEAGDPSSEEPPKRPRPPLYVLVEKILGPDEPLPESWPVAGTSGYDFLNSLNGLFIAPQGQADLVKFYNRFRGEPLELRQVEYESKLLILRVAMSSELQMLAHRLNRISEQHRRSRDLTLNMLRLAVREVLACFPVYRIYPGHGRVSDRDRHFVNMAVSRARRRNSAFDASVFEFLRNVLLLEHPPGLTSEQIAVRELFSGKFQQVTSPVMAKGVEDTAFYVYVPLASANEVGSHPGRPAVAVADFHEDNLHRNRRLPQAMLATSTHDTKRSEDVRARLNVLTEMSGDWRQAVNYFRRINQRWRREIDGESAPSRNDEYLYYQSALGIWPKQRPTPEEKTQLVGRLQAYMEKATHEAKQRTSWINPHPVYDETMRRFIASSLEESPGGKFVQELESLWAKAAPTGQYNGLFQTALKLLSPGIPDIYQGQEIWDYSLVDPDNRRPVDYRLRRHLLEEIRRWESLQDDDWRSQVETLARSPFDPRLKLLVTHKLLRLRCKSPDLFVEGEYLPLAAHGGAAHHLVAFAWRARRPAQTRIVAVIPRLVHGMLSSPPVAPTEPLFRNDAWADTYIQAPEDVGIARCLFSRLEVPPVNSRWQADKLFASFPLAVLLVED